MDFAVGHLAHSNNKKKLISPLVAHVGVRACGWLHAVSQVSQRGADGTQLLSYGDTA